jgi:hypothetical protein
MDAALGAEAVLDDVLVERVRTRGKLRGLRVKACSRTNQSREPLREQIEQLQDSATSISPSTSNAIAPQWQLPV